jgi:hypothetical protein
VAGQIGARIHGASWHPVIISPVVSLSHLAHNSASAWFQAIGALGDDTGILYGRVDRGSQSVEWFRVSHAECDGIGGFARLLRAHGHDIRSLPKTNSSCRDILGPLWNLWRNRRRPPECASRRDWMPGGARLDGVANPVAWHVFTDVQTGSIRDACRRGKITVNSLLLKHLDASVRPEIGTPSAIIPWMIPVNLRGDVSYPDDTENHVSSVDVLVCPDESAFSIHQKILHQLDQGEHRANFLLMELGGILSHGFKMRYLRRDRARPRGNIGAFSNLGSWNADSRIDSADSWLFCPPVVHGQRLSAGCVTFRNQLSLTMQSHPHESLAPDLVTRRMVLWVAGILSETE